MRAMWNAPDCGPGRDLRSPEQRPGYRPPWTEGSGPRSDDLDDLLHGYELLHPERPGQRPGEPLPASQLYGLPDPGDIQRDGHGHAQVVIKTRPKRQTPGEQHPSELPWEFHPPRRPGFEIHHVRGSSQILPEVTDVARGVVGLLGGKHFTGDRPAPSPSSVCRWCGIPLTSTGSGDRERMYCSASHKQAAYEQRKRDRMAAEADEE